MQRVNTDIVMVIIYFKKLTHKLTIQV